MLQKFCSLILAMLLNKNKRRLNSQEIAILVELLNIQAVSDKIKIEKVNCSIANSVHLSNFLKTLDWYYLLQLSAHKNFVNFQ